MFNKITGMRTYFRFSHYRHIQMHSLSLDPLPSRAPPRLKIGLESEKTRISTFHRRNSGSDINERSSFESLAPLKTEIKCPPFIKYKIVKTFFLMIQDIKRGPTLYWTSMPRLWTYNLLTFKSGTAERARYSWYTLNLHLNVGFVWVHCRQLKRCVICPHTCATFHQHWSCQNM